MNKILGTISQVKGARALGGGEIRHTGEDSFYAAERRALRTKFEKESDA
jgi:hypothetical protein